MLENAIGETFVSCRELVETSLKRQKNSINMLTKENTAEAETLTGMLGKEVDSVRQYPLLAVRFTRMCFTIGRAWPYLQQNTTLNADRETGTWLVNKNVEKLNMQCNTLIYRAYVRTRRKAFCKWTKL